MIIVLFHIKLASCCCININRDDFETLYIGSQRNHVQITEHYASFKQFLEKVLCGHKASFLDKFLIRFPIYLDKLGSDIVRTCMNFCTKFSPLVFSMEGFIPSKDLLAWIFTCESIETMFLSTTYYCGFSKTIPEVVSLARIKRLQLKFIGLDERSITILYSGCPLLEELILKWCFVEISSIFNLKLKYLSLSECKWDTVKSVLRNLSLHFFRRITMFVKSSILGDTIESVISNFVEGNFGVQFFLTTSSTSRVSSTLSFLQNILHPHFGVHLRCLSEATVLKLHRENFKMLERELQELGEFHHLKELSLAGWCMACKFRPVALFLQKSPNLRKLTLYNCKRHYLQEKASICHVIDNSMWVEISQCKNLKLVEIKFSDDQVAHELEESLLSNRKQLKNIEVVLSQTAIGPFSFLRGLSSMKMGCFPGSNCCGVV